MNAPAPAAHVAAPALGPSPDSTRILLSLIKPSRTDVQELRRARLDKALLADLTANVKIMDVLQPLVLRPIDGGFEIVAGERRWLAAKGAGLTSVPAVVRELTDLQVVEIQLTENVQREGLHPLDEAVGYRSMMQLGKLNAEDVGARLGKSRSWVYNRLKLNDLCPEARKALNAGEIAVSVAELIARIGHPEVQGQALETIIEDQMPFREAQEFIHREYMVELKNAAFSLADAELLPKAGPCTTCPKRTGNQKDLFHDVKNPNVCTDPKCLTEKNLALAQRKRVELEAKGETVIAGAEAKKIKPHRHARIAGAYVALDDQEYLGGKYQSYRKALGKELPPEQLLEDPETLQLIPIAKAADVEKALKAKGVKRDSGRSNGNTDQKARERKARIESAARMEILSGIRKANAKRSFDLADTRLVAGHMLERLDFDSRKRLVDALLADRGAEKPKGHDHVHAFDEEVQKMDARELAVLMIDVALVGDCHVASYGTADVDVLHATAKRVGVDPDRIRRDVQARFAEKAAKKKRAAKKGAKK